MTNAPADLLAFRADIQALTGLSAPDVGIVGNGAHQKTGGYHEGKDTLVANGLWSSDYSVRLTRDRNAAGSSASAVDVGAGWRQGRAAWLRWNNALVAALHAHDPALAPIRAVNYSPDGVAKRRTDREAGWSVASSNDSVDIHTHIEWYRDTEGRRQASLDRIVALARQAATGGIVLTSTVTQGYSMTDSENIAHIRAELDRALNGFAANGDGTGNLLPAWISGFQQAQNAMSAQLAAIAAKVGAPVQVTLSPDQLAAIATTIVNHPQNPLSAQDQPAIVAALKQYYAGLA